MKEFRLRIPTSFSEARQILKERTDRRLRHNQSVLREFAQEVSKLAYNGYWQNDISDEMKSRVFALKGSTKLLNLLGEYLPKLK